MRWLGLVCFLGIALASCQSKTSYSNRVIYKPSYAKGFQIALANQDTVLELLNPKGEVTSSILLNRNPQRIAALSTTCFYFLKELNVLHLLAGQGYLDRIQDESIPLLSTQCLSENGDLVKEKLLALQPDLILAIPFDQQDWKALLPNAEVVNIAEYLEEHPLGRTEWLVAIGYVLHKSSQAKLVFSQIEQEYLLEKSKGSAANHPRVVFATDNGSDFTVAPLHSYWSTLVSDAGGDYQAHDGEANQVQQTEGMLTALHNADYYGELVYQPGSEGVDLVEKRSVFSNTPPFQNKHLFYCNSAHSQFFDKGVMQPHLMLKDLRAILENNTAHQGVYFKRN